MKSKTMNFVLTRTPLRISYAGGGSDFEFFLNRHSGAILTSAINKYIYVVIKTHSELYPENFRISYQNVENIYSLNQVRNKIIRNTLSYFNIDKKLYISTFGDLPAGTGLGSSSAFTVGLVNAINLYFKLNIQKNKILEIAYSIEIDLCKSPIGLQDPIPSVFGGFNFIELKSNRNFELYPINSTNHVLEKLISQSIILYTGQTRNVDKIFKKNKDLSKVNIDNLIELSKFATETYHEILKENLDFKNFANKMTNMWNYKMTLQKNSESQKIIQLFKKGIQNGAYGGKLMGAGGGGFILFIVPLNRQKYFYKKMKSFFMFKPKINNIGSEALINI